MIEQRRIRFTCIDGIEREDLPLACEVWRIDVFSASWSERAAMKLATQLTRYICDPSPAKAVLQEIESHYHLSRDEVMRALQMMRSYGVVDSYSVEQSDLRVALHLTLMQRLRVLEAKQQFQRHLGRAPEVAKAPPSWLPQTEAVKEIEVEPAGIGSGVPAAA